MSERLGQDLHAALQIALEAMPRDSSPMAVRATIRHNLTLEFLRLAKQFEHRCLRPTSITYVYVPLRAELRWVSSGEIAVAQPASVKIPVSPQIIDDPTLRDEEWRDALDIATEFYAEQDPRTRSPRA